MHETKEYRKIKENGMMQLRRVRLKVMLFQAGSFDSECNGGIKVGENSIEKHSSTRKFLFIYFLLNIATFMSIPP